jgi:hypothetical protein
LLIELFSFAVLLLSRVLSSLKGACTSTAD